MAIALALSGSSVPGGAAEAERPTSNAVPTVNPFRAGRTLVIPHGGGDGLFPEDTMLAYERTMAMGADVVDVDLRLSADGVLVAIHDADTRRTTGQAGLVSAMTASQLRLLDAGWSFATSTSHPFRGRNVRIPTLDAILRRFPQALLSLDLKDESMTMIKPVCELLRLYNRRSNVFVGSNNDEQILNFRLQCNDVRTSATLVDVYASQAARNADAKDFVPAVVVDQPPYRIAGRVLVDAASLAFAHAHAIAILTWVVNDPVDMKRLINLGVDGIYTSYPDRLLKLLHPGR